MPENQTFVVICIYDKGGVTHQRKHIHPKEISLTATSGSHYVPSATTWQKVKHRYIVICRYSASLENKRNSCVFTTVKREFNSCDWSLDVGLTPCITIQHKYRMEGRREICNKVCFFFSPPKHNLPFVWEKSEKALPYFLM